MIETAMANYRARTREHWTRSVTVRLPPTVAVLLAARADAEGSTRSALAARLLDDAILGGVECR